MFSKQQLSKLKQNCVLINTARGAVIDNNALLEALKAKRLQSILDVWEGEPEINLQLHQACLYGSPHIAGYSKDGKQQGTRMLQDALFKFLGLPKANNDLNCNIADTITWQSDKSFYENLKYCILKSYDLQFDSAQLSQLDKTNIQKKFDLLRKNYPDRLEFKHYSILNVPQQYKQQIRQLGFHVNHK